MNIIECDDLCRSYGTDADRMKKKIVLEHLNLSVKSGEIYGLAGKNGSGKTTLIKILTTLLYPNAGTAFVNGYNVVEEAKNVRKSIGAVLSNNRALYLKLTALENMKFFSNLYLVPRKMQDERIECALKAVGLWEHRKEYTENFSYGMMQRLNIARTLLPNPKLLIFDEPTNGLDLESINELRKLIFALKQEGKTILLTTHNLNEVEILSTRMGLLKNGKIIKEGTPHELKAQFTNKIFEVSVKKDSVNSNVDVLEKAFKRHISIEADRCEELAALRFEGNSEWNMEYIMRNLKALEIEPFQIACKDASLEDIFFKELREENG